MAKDIEYFTKIFEKQIEFNKRHAHSNIGYGENVMPVLEIYNDLSDFIEREAFRNTLVKFLTDKNKGNRDFAVDVCLGFLVFRDVIGKKR